MRWAPPRRREVPEDDLHLDLGDVLHASVNASGRLSWARHSGVPDLAQCIQLGLLGSRTFSQAFML